MNYDDYIEHLFKLHYARLVAVAQSMLRDTDESRDVVSDVFALMWERKQRLLPDAEWQYLAVSVRNRCLKRLAHAKAEQRAQLLYPIELAIYGADESHRHRLEALPGAMAAGLDEQQRQAIDLCFGQGMTQSQAADRMGISLATVGRRIVSAVRILKETFKKSAE